MMMMPSSIVSTSPKDIVNRNHPHQHHAAAAAAASVHVVKQESKALQGGTEGVELLSFLLSEGCKLGHNNHIPAVSLSARDGVTSSNKPSTSNLIDNNRFFSKSGLVIRL